jgi:hypothetical protein
VFSMDTKNEEIHSDEVEGQPVPRERWSKKPSNAQQSRSAPFSTHSRGVPLFEQSLSSAQRTLSHCILDLRDIGSSLFWFLSLQSWLTFWSCIINIVSLVFFNFYKSKGLATPVDLVVIEIVVVVPLIGFIWLLHQRRDKCLDLLSEVKTGFLFLIRRVSDELAVQLLTATEQATNEKTMNTSKSFSLQQSDAKVHLIVQRTKNSVSKVLTGMHEYFLPSRFYSTRYPYLGYKSAMVQIALDRSKWQRQIRRGLEELDGIARSLEVSSSERGALLDMVYRLHTSIDKLCNAKEFGTPQGIRAMVRCYTTLIIPLFFAPYWAFVSQSADFAVAFFVSLAFQVALIGLLNVAITLEDPFDNVGMCGIFIDEQLFEVESVLHGLGDFAAVAEGPHQLNGGNADELDNNVENVHVPVVRVATDNV